MVVITTFLIIPSWVLFFWSKKIPNLVEMLNKSNIYVLLILTVSSSERNDLEYTGAR